MSTPAMPSQAQWLLLDGTHDERTPPDEGLRSSPEPIGRVSDTEATAQFHQTITPASNGPEVPEQMAAPRSCNSFGLERDGVKLSYEAWQFQRHYWTHMAVCFSYISVMAIGFLCGREQLRFSLSLTIGLGLMFVLSRYLASSAKNQAAAQRAVEYIMCMILVLRLGISYFAGGGKADNLLENPVLCYGWDIVRPFTTAFLLPTMAARPSIVVAMFVMYAAKCFYVTAELLLQAKIASDDGSGTVEHSLSWGELQMCSVIPLYVFVFSLATCTLQVRQSRSVFDLMAQQQTSHALEVAATKRAADSEQRAREAEQCVYQESLQQRNKYLGAMCHDFGTPVAVLQMLLSMMRQRLRRDLRRERRDAAAIQAEAEGADSSAAAANRQDRIVEQGRPASSASHSSSSFASPHSYEDNARMLDLIRRASAGLELLEVTRQKAIAYSKLQAGGRLVPDCKPFEIAALLRKAASVVRDTGKSDLVRVLTRVEKGLPLVVKSDANWLFMMLVNFGSNAMKHTSQGRVTISVMRSGDSLLRIEVSDTGTGVPAEFVPSLFQPFTSASRTATSVESTGLGLYHSKQLAGILNGETGYRPNACGGAMFYVEVPMEFVSASKADEVLAKNRLEFEGLTAAPAPAQRGKASTPRAGRCARAASAKTVGTSVQTSSATADAAPGGNAIGEGNRTRAAGESGGSAGSVAAPPARDTHQLMGPYAAEPCEVQASSTIPAAATFQPHGALLTPSPSLRRTISEKARVQPLVSNWFEPSVPLASLLSRMPPPLLVDDSELSREVMREQLEAWAGVVPLEAESGQEALSILTGAQRPVGPEWMLLDDHMPGLSGRDTCKAIRTWEQARGVAHSQRLRVVGLLTFTGDAAGHAACLDAGMDAAIVKPFDADTLHSTLQSLL